MQRTKQLILAIGLFGLAGVATGQALAQQTLSKSQAFRTFAAALVDGCLVSLEASAPIFDSPSAKMLQLRAATADEREFSPAKDEKTPVWVTAALGQHLSIAEMAPDKCVVTMDQLPVDDTLKIATAYVMAARRDFADVPQTPGYWPVVREWTRIEQGVRYTIHIDAAEPGAPGHLFRFSLITATVTRAAASSTSNLQQDASRADRRAKILSALAQHSNRFLHIAPRIPAEIQTNALKNSAKLGSDQDLLAVVDQTAFRNGNVGVYFFVDGIVTMRAAIGQQFIPYSVLRSKQPSKGAFIVSYGDAQVPANLIGKDEMIAILGDVVAATQ